MPNDLAKWAAGAGFGAEAAALTAAGIESTEALWRRVASGAWDSVPGAAPDRLLALCAALAERDNKAEKASLVGRYGHEAVFCLALLVFVILVLRATGHPFFGRLQQNIAADVVVAAHRLPVGHVIRESDLGRVRMTLRDGMLTAGSFNGMIVRQDISADAAIMSDDLLSAQAVAARDIPAATKPTRKDIEIQWLTYDPEALTTIQEATGVYCPAGVRKGSPIVRRNITAGP